MFLLNISVAISCGYYEITKGLRGGDCVDPASLKPALKYIYEKEAGNNEIV